MTVRKWKCTYSSGDKWTRGKVYEEVNGEVKSNYMTFSLYLGKDFCGSYIMTMDGYKFKEVTSMFGKSDLKTGMFVQTRNGEKWMVLRNSIYGDLLVSLERDKFGRSRSRVELSEYAEDMQHKGMGALDIMKVTSPNCYPDVFEAESELTSAMVVYQREELKELTVKQIEELLGYAVKIVKEGE